jgi:hypothetical protein
MVLAALPAALLVLSRTAISLTADVRVKLKCRPENFMFRTSRAVSSMDELYANW